MAEYKTDEQKKKFYKGSKWIGTRKIALIKQNYECQECKRLGYVHVDSVKEPGKRKTIELNVHHIKELEDHPELAYDIDNLEVLCLHHHNVAHGRVFGRTSKPKWDDERW